MADTTTEQRLNPPPFAATIANEGEETARLEILQRQNIQYQERKLSWQVLLDAYEGSGGFLDGSYLWPYPREDPGNFSRRMAMARYSNYEETLVDLYVRYATENVKRVSNSETYNAWSENVDGNGTSLSGLMIKALSVALVHGHCGILVDKTAAPPDGPTKADENAMPVACVFNALAIPDWRFTNHALSAVKLYEAAPEPGIEEEPLDGDEAIQYLLWNVDGWARFDAKGIMIGADMPDLGGVVPLVLIQPKDSYRSNTMLGRALVSNANLLQALFNRASEEDEVLRAQAFSLLTIEVPQDGDVEQVRANLGDTIGALKAVVTKGKVQYATPDQNAPQTIRDNQSYLIREIYRCAGIRYQDDSRNTQTAEAIRLQQSELNETLQGITQSLEAAEMELARLYFLWTEPTPEAALAAFEAAEVEITYPDEFFVDALITDLEAWAEGIRMGLGDTMNKRIKKATVRRIDPNIPQDELAKIDAEIDGQSAEELSNTPPMLVDTGDPEGQAIAASAQGDGAGE